MCRTCSGVSNASRADGPAEAVVLGRELGVVPGREALELRPALPAGRERALLAARLQLRRGQRHFGPGLRRLVRIEPGLLERVLVVIEDGRRAVQRVRHHLAVRRGVVAGHRGHVDLRIELVAGLAHHFADRHDRAFRTHHRRGADLEHLQDVRRVAGAIGGDRRRHRDVVCALVGRRDLALLLAGVETARQAVDPVAQGARHRVPPLHLGLGQRAGRAEREHDAAAAFGAMSCGTWSPPVV